MPDPVVVNRAPVLTLWAAVVAERLGHDRAAALTLGKGVAGLTAQSKGRRLGIFGVKEGAPRAESAPDREEFRVALCGRQIACRRTREGVRALVKGTPVSPEQVRGYLERAFGSRLAEVRTAMEGLSTSMPADELEERAFSLYESFRPQVAAGSRGWGQKGELRLETIRRLARRERG